MARTKITKTYTTVYEHFKNLDSFIDTMEERPLNKAFQGETSPSSTRDESHKRKFWSGTADYTSAKDVLRIGYKDPLQKMKEAILKIGENDENVRPRMRNDFIGFVPNVPNHLMNLPQTMLNRERVIPKQKTIHLTYSFCASAKTSADEIIKGGINFISLVNSLEKQGYRVKIDIIFTSVENGTAASFSINLKQYDQQTNILKLAFPLVHPAMLRRFAFKWLETTPDLKERGFSFGYGMPLNVVTNNNAIREREYLKEREILKGENSYYCNVYQALKARTIEELAQEMEITKR